MYIIELTHRGSSVPQFYGPFPSRDRAVEYGFALQQDLNLHKWEVKPLVVPFQIKVEVVG